MGVCHRRAEAEGVAEQEQVPQGEAEGGCIAVKQTVKTEGDTAEPVKHLNVEKQ